MTPLPLGFMVIASEPGTPAPRPGTGGRSGFQDGLCIVCAGRTFASSHTNAPRWNAHSITQGSNLANALGINLKRSALAPWYALVTQAETLDDFATHDQQGGFWTSLGIVCRACSGLPGIGNDWRAEVILSRCSCGWERQHPHNGDEWMAERRAERSLRAHRAARHAKVSVPA